MFFCLSGYDHGVNCHHIFPGFVSEPVSWPLLLSPPGMTQPVWFFKNKDCVIAQVRNLQQLSFSFRIKARVLTMVIAQILSLGCLPQTHFTSLCYTDLPLFLRNVRSIPTMRPFELALLWIVPWIVHSPDRSIAKPLPPSSFYLHLTFPKITALSEVYGDASI